MKRIFYSTIILFALLSCAKEPVTGGSNTDGSLATAVTVDFFGFENEDGTKATLSPRQGEAGLDFLWATGDTIAVWPLTLEPGQIKTQVRFKLNGTTGTKTTKFDGAGWGMICNGANQYASYFPYSPGTESEESVSVTFPTYFSDKLNKGQLTHLYKYLYAYAPAIKPENAAGANFSFYQLGALAKFIIKTSETAKFSRITISADTDTDVFYTSASYSLVKEGMDGVNVKPTITGTPTEKTIGARLNNVKLENSGDSLVVYFPMCPAKLKDVKLIVRLYAELDSLYADTLTCHKNQVSGVCYNYRANVKPTPKILPPKIEGVDLGNGLLFAPFNLGATRPEEFGLPFAYGETDTKATFTQDNYKYWDKEKKTYLKPTLKDTCYYNQNNVKANIQVFADSTDAAVKMWGDGWITPSYTAINAWLQNNCDRESTVCNGVEGMRFYNKTDRTKSIFVPYTNHSPYNTGTLHTVLWTECGFVELITPSNDGFGRSYPPYEANYIRPVKIMPQR